MARWIKRLLPAVLVFGLCLGGAVWYWRAGQRTPDSTDLVLWLLVLPLAILAVLWLGRLLFAVLAGAPAAAAAAPDAAPPAEAATAPAAAPLPALALVASALRSPHGDAAAELAAALAGGKAHPALDPELLDDDGYPQMSARAVLADSAAEGEALRDQLITWLALNGHPGAAFSDEQWRTLALASAVATELGERSAAHAKLADHGKQTPAPILQLLPLWPHGWQAAQYAQAGAWLAHLVGAAGWPPERIVVAPAEPLLDSGEALLRLAQHGGAARSPLLAIVLAAGSNIGNTTLSQWSGAGSLFSARHPQGMIPGEGAAGLLLADSAQAALLGEGPHAQLHAASALRDASADGARRADPTMLHNLARQVLADGGTAPDTVALLVADTGHRNSRTMELMALAGAVLPQLDAGEDVLRVGSACGSCGEVALVTSLAIGAHHSAELDAPVLCIGNEDPFRRSAALILPAPPPVAPLTPVTP